MLAQRVADSAKAAMDRYNMLNAQLVQCEALELQAKTQRNVAVRLESEMKTTAVSSEILSSASAELRRKAKKHFEDIVTNALQFIMQDADVKFVIEESMIRGKPAYEFYVERTVNGVPSRQKPEDAEGGGIVDIISLTLKYAYSQIYNSPPLMNATMFFDEPAKMVSEGMSLKVAEYIQFLDKYFSCQTVMITHNENLAAVADKTFYISRDASGTSHASEMKKSAKDIESVMDIVNKAVTESGDGSEDKD